MNLPPELQAYIENAIRTGSLNLGQIGTRSPMRPRQLHDLTLLPTADDPRPTFFWSALKPRDLDVSKTHEFPKLMWHGTTGTEITVQSRDEQQAHLSMGYVLTAPHTVAVDPMAEFQAAFDALSAQDRELLVKSIEQDRISKLKMQLGSLPPDQLEALLANAAQPQAKKSKVA